MAKAKRLPSGSWRIRVYTGKNAEGKKQYKSVTAPTKREAETKAARVLVNVGKEQERKKNQDKRTLDEAVGAYIDVRRNVLSPTTLCSYEGIRRRLPAPLLETTLDYVTQELLQRFIDDTAGALGPKTVRNMGTLVTAALRFVREDRTFRLRYPQPKRIEYHNAELEDVKKLIHETDGTPLGTALAIAAFTGLRRSEVAALKREDVDPVENVLHVRRAMVANAENKVIVKSTKTSSSEREIDLSPEQVRYILEHDSGGEYLVGMAPAAITNGFIRVRNKLGSTFRLHDLRSYYISALHALGLPDKYIIAQSGHETTYVMNRVYNRATRQRVHAAMEPLTRAFDNILPKDDTPGDRKPKTQDCASRA
jgi:integrase